MFQNVNLSGDRIYIFQRIASKDMTNFILFEPLNLVDDVPIKLKMTVIVDEDHVCIAEWHIDETISDIASYIDSSQHFDLEDFIRLYSTTPYQFHVTVRASSFYVKHRQMEDATKKWVRKRTQPQGDLIVMDDSDASDMVSNLETFVMDMCKGEINHMLVALFTGVELLV